MEATGSEGEFSVAPDGCLDILFSAKDGLRAVGTMTREQRYPVEPGTTVGIRFRPGMAGAFLKARPSELTDAIEPLDAFWGHSARNLEERLRNSNGSVDSVCRMMLDALEPACDAPDPVQRAIDSIVREHGCADLDTIARQANLSVRQFRRRCLEESGLTPKHLCRVLRFRHAGKLAARAGWSQVAAEAGYFDQAHLIRDFREFTGRTPAAKA
jgi:AraC-like DNA-binding protein